ncbi:MAG TPA: hypothetical protein VN652_03085 [Geobacteraceae bacterium]|nr:hypothetical protein [Geobacteraceae bacterium]
MNSRIAESIKLAAEPVALLWSDSLPEDAVMFEKGRWGCVMSLVAAAAFTIPWKRFREMEDNVRGSFLEGDIWNSLIS